MTEPASEHPEKIVTAELVPVPSSASPATGRDDHTGQTSVHPVSSTSLGKNEIFASLAGDSPLAYTPPPPIPEDMDNVAAIGGAMGALVLGVWSIVGSFVSPWSVVNSGLGVLLGLWGLTSRYPRWAGVGMFLCFLGFLFSALQIGDLVMMLFREKEPEI